MKYFLDAVSVWNGIIKPTFLNSLDGGLWTSQPLIHADADAKWGLVDISTRRFESKG